MFRLIDCGFARELDKPAGYFPDLLMKGTFAGVS